MPTVDSPVHPLHRRSSYDMRKNPLPVVSAFGINRIIVVIHRPHPSSSSITVPGILRATIRCRKHLLTRRQFITSPQAIIVQAASNNPFPKAIALEMLFLYHVGQHFGISPLRNVYISAIVKAATGAQVFIVESYCLGLHNSLTTEATASSSLATTQYSNSDISHCLRESSLRR